MSEFIGWLSQYLGIDKTPTATIMVSLTVFGLGILTNETIKAIVGFRERKTTRKIVRRNYLIFRDYLFDQAKALRDFKSLLTAKSGPNFNAYVLPCAALDNYKDISYKNSFKAFFSGLENIILLGKNNRIVAFDNLYNSLSIIRIEQERMFPIIANFQVEATAIIVKLNRSLDNAFEATADVNMKLRNQPSSYDLTEWLDVRRKFYENYFAQGDPEDLNDVKDYFLAIIDIETKDKRPLDLIMDEKDFFYYRKKVHQAIGDIDVLHKLVNNTQAYCMIVSKKFDSTAHQLVSLYQPLFGKKI